jgi:hypothetical protein
MISVPDLLPFLLNRPSCLELRIEECRQKIGRQIAGSEVDPRVLVYFASEEATAVCAFLPNHERSFQQLGAVDDECSPFATGKILSFVEALGREAAELSRIRSFVAREQTMGIVLYDPNAVAGSRGQNRIHFARNSGIVNYDDRLGAGRYEGLQTTLVEIQSVGTNVCEHQTRSSQGESIRGRDKGKRWDDYLVLGAAVEQERSHLQSMRTRSGQQDAWNAKFPLEKFVALAGEGSVTGGVPIGNGFRNVFVFIACQAGSVKWDAIAHFEITNR